MQSACAVSSSSSSSSSAAAAAAAAAACLALPCVYVPHYLINGIIFVLKQLFNIKRVFRFSLQFLSEKFIILRRIKRDIITNVRRSSCKVPAVVIFNKT